MAELFIEILSADIPARMQKKAAADFGDLIIKGLDESEIPYGDVHVHSTPRRMIVCIDGIPAKIEDTSEERRGPRADAPEQAVQGFLRGNGLESLDQCVQKETEKGTFWFAIITKKGGDTKTRLGEIITNAIQNLAWPKSMRWGETAFRWARPLKNVVAIFDGDVVDGTFELGGNAPAITFSNTALGHRFLSNGEITVKDFADYQTKMHSHYVMITREDRKQIIMEETSQIAAKLGLKPLDDNALIEEIVGLIEWPVVLCGTFDDLFLSVPQECLISTMKKDQKYIPLLTKEGTLSNRFVVVSNMVTQDNGAKIIAGNEKVLRARLSDAKFFYDQDLKIKLEDRTPQLADIKFHDKLGTVEQRTQRLEILAKDIASMLSYDADNAALAARLAKADLVTGMVGEFPELQGIMGRYYALAQGLSPDVAYAIEDHYKPAGPDDECPSKDISIALALADKIDVLTGFFAIDEKPTGSKDPFALRRAGLGIIRIILENNIDIDLATLFDKAYAHYGDIVKGTSNPSTDLLQFIADRMKVTLKDKGVRYDLIDAVFALGLDGNLNRVMARVNALQNFLKTDDGVNLLAGYKRASNIVSIEEKKEGTAFKGQISATLFLQSEEEKLYEILTQTEEKIGPALSDEKFENVMSEMAKLRAPIDAFFDKVTVNDNNNDLRLNRLNMLSKIKTTLNQVADFTKIEG